MSRHLGSPRVLVMHIGSEQVVWTRSMESIESIAYIPSGEHLAVGVRHGRVDFLDSSCGAVLKSLLFREPMVRGFRGQPLWVTAIGYAPDISYATGWSVRDCEVGLDKPDRVIEYVDHHGEPAARRDESLLEEQALHDWADNVTRLVDPLRHTANGIEANDVDGDVMSNMRELQSDIEGEVRLLTFTRSPNSLDQALLATEELRETREALRRAGHAVSLPSGAKVLVAPEEYATAIAAIQGKNLEKTNVIVSAHLVPVVKAAVRNGTSHKQNVRVKSEFAIAYKYHEDDEVGVVKNTFLCSSLPHRGVSSVVNSTSILHHATNPRQPYVV